MTAKLWDGRGAPGSDAATSRGQVLEVSEKRFADVAVLTTVGRIDLETSESFQSQILEAVERIAADGSALLLDLAGVDYVNSVGLRALMIAAKQCKANNTRIAVAELGEVVREIFEISRFSFVVEVFDTVPAALSALSDEAAAAYQTG